MFHRDILKTSIVTTSCVLAMAGVGQAQLAPQEAAPQVEAAAGLRVQLFAHEPQLLAPTAIDVDEQGRVWVVEGVNYRKAGGPRIKEPPYFPQPLRKTGDRVVVLEDTDGDGRCDTARVFYEGLDINSPQGFAVFGGKVWISQSPSIRTIEIKDDGTAGRVETLLTGFGGTHGDHSVHSVYLGPDGKLYSCFGNTHTVLALPDGKKIDNWSSGAKGGVVFRMNLDATGFEVLGDNFRNGYECATDSFGTTFYSDNDDDEGNQYCRFVYVMLGGNFGHQPKPPRGHDWNLERPGVIPYLMRTGAGAPAGLCVYEGDLLPAKYLGTAMLAETGAGELLGFRLSPDGAGFRVDGTAVDEEGRQTIPALREIRKPDVLLRSDDRWFRPSDVAVAPDGSLFVADFYNRIAGGRQLDDELRGRVYRLIPADHDGSYKPPATNLNDEKRLIAALASPNLAARAGAILHLEKSDAAMLAKHLKTDSPRLRARILYQLARLGERAPVEESLSDDDPNIRVTAVRALSQNGGVSTEVLKSLAKDKSPQVRRELLLAARGMEVDDALQDILVDLALQYDGYDRFYLEAVLLAIAGKDKEGVRATILAKIDGRADRTAAGLQWAIQPQESLARFTMTATDKKRSAADRVVATERLAMYGEPAAGQTLVELLDGDAPPALARAALDGLLANIDQRWKSLTQDATLLPLVQPWTENATTREVALSLASKALGTTQLTEITADEASQLADPKDRLDPGKLPPASELLAIEGDAGRGRNVFFRETTACAKCHSIDGQGAKTTALGPALDGIGKKLGRDGLLESILRPQANVAPQWVAQTVVTSDGKVHAGLIAEESPEQLVLTALDGQRVAIAKEDIESQRPSEQSLMPQQLVGNMTPQNLADLLQYLLDQ